MENHNTSPTNNVSKDNLISANHIYELPISAVFSNKNSNGDQIMSTEDVEGLMKKFPPGFRFYPTDYELIKHYLERKLANLPLHPNKIYEMNIYKYDPNTIAAYLKPTTEEKVWYVFTPRDRKYPNGERPDRCTGNGYWKATGADKRIDDEKNSKIGSRRALVYYIGKSPKGEKTDWIMHEYMVPKIPIPNSSTPRNTKLDEWVLCRFYNKNDVIATKSTRRKRKRKRKRGDDDPFIDEVCEDSTRNDSTTNCNNNDNHGMMTFSEGIYQEDPIRNELTNNFNNNDNHGIMTFSEGTYQEDPIRNELTNNFNNNDNHGIMTFSEGTYQEDPIGNDPTNYLNNNNNHGIMTFSEGTYEEDTIGNDPTNYFNNNNNPATMFFEGTDQDSMRNYPTNFNNNYNNAMTLHPQVHMGLSTLPHYSYLPVLSNYQNYVSDHFNNYTAGTPTPSPLMMEPIATNNSIGHDYTMNNQGFGGGYGEYPEHDQYYAFDQYIVDNYESQYNTNNFVNCENTTSNNIVNGETSTSKGDNNFVNCENTTSNNFVNGETSTSKEEDC